VKQADAVEVEKSFTLVDIAVSVANNFDVSARAIPNTTQNVVILPNEEFDETVQADLHIIKQVSDAMEKGEKSFTPVISKSQKKKIKQLVRRVGQPYNTRYS
jgi:hypothetical protein